MRSAGFAAERGQGSGMFSVVFEVRPKDGCVDAYLGYAKLLRPEVERIDGFIAVDRFASRTHPGLLLSHSVWRDEKSLIRWRTLAVHHDVQGRSRAEVFAQYRLRVGEVSADTHAPAGHAVRAQRLDETEVGDARVVSVTEFAVAHGERIAAFVPSEHAEGLVDCDVYDSIYVPGNVLVLASWRDAAAHAAGERAIRARGDRATPAGIDATVRRRAIRVIRDYGMFDRREAPQYYAPVPSDVPV